MGNRIDGLAMIRGGERRLFRILHMPEDNRPAASKEP
jgi:hypothetical protein